MCVEKEFALDGTSLCELLTSISSFLEVFFISLFRIYFTTFSLCVELEFINTSYLLGFFSKDMGRVREVLAFIYFFLLLRVEYEA